MSLILTPRMIRDTLAIQGPQSLRELASNLKAPSNVIQTILLDLASAGEVSYSYDSGKWLAEVTL